MDKNEYVESLKKQTNSEFRSAVNNQKAEEEKYFSKEQLKSYIELSKDLNSGNMTIDQIEEYTPVFEDLVKECIRIAEPHFNYNISSSMRIKDGDSTKNLSSSTDKNKLVPTDSISITSDIRTISEDPKYLGTIGITDMKVINRILNKINAEYQKTKDTTKQVERDTLKGVALDGKINVIGVHKGDNRYMDAVKEQLHQTEMLQSQEVLEK